MTNPLRPLALAAALNVTIGVGAAAAQTVIVRSLTPGETVEVVLNATSAGSAAADARGDAKIPVNLAGTVGKNEIDANIFVDTCDKVRRVLIVERGQATVPEGGCVRRDVGGLYLVRRVTSLVVNVGGANPTVMLVQGSFSLEPEDPARVWSPSPAGLIVFGGAGLARFRDAEALACGNVSDCSGDASGFAFTAGGTFWLTRFLGAEGSYVRPSKTTARGSGSNFRFDSSYDVHVTTIAGKVGAPIGSVRLYGRAGANYHKAASSSTLTTDDVTTTVDGVSTTVEGGTQTIELKTDGWGWLFGGGIEVWLARSFALSGDFGVADLNGKALGGGEGEVDDRLSYVFVGAHIRIFGR